MPNPTGTNQFDRFAREAPQGDVKRLQQLQRSAPVSGAPIAAGAINAPRRLQRQAVKGNKPKGGQAAQAEAQAPAMPDNTPYAVKLAEAWKEIAAIPGISDLAKAYAIEAEKQANLGQA